MALWKRRENAGERRWEDPAVPALVLACVFAGPYFLGLLFRSPEVPPYDRYLIPFLPLAAIPLLRYYKVHTGSRVSGWSWALLALFAVYAVATTHDAFAGARARLTAARDLERTGIRRNEIMAGFEYDGWTQLEAAGYLNNPQIENPAGAYRPVTCTGPRAWWLPKMPAVQARYVVALSRFPELENARAGQVGYTTWLPPARRQVFTQMLPAGSYAGCR